MARETRPTSQRKQGGYATFCNVHLTVTARNDIRLRDITRHSRAGGNPVQTHFFMAMPDGKPLSIFAKLRGLKDVQ